MAEPPVKAEGAFRTIGELSRDTGLPQHILRFWETRFPQLRPLQRAGNRRYYRPEDVALVRRIHALLDQQGYTIRGVQQLLAAEGKKGAAPPSVAAAPTPPPLPESAAPSAPVEEPAETAMLFGDLRAIRDYLIEGITDDRG